MGKALEQREKCWSTRDEYFKCIDDPSNFGLPKEDDVCLSLQLAYENSCPESWVKYFQQKKDRDYLISTQAQIGELR